MSIQDIKEKIRNCASNEEAVSILTDYIKQNPQDDEAYTMRGMKYWGLGQRANAINDYLQAIEINPDSKARLALKATNEILDYYNKDLYNP